MNQTEREKMSTGQLYCSQAKELDEDRMKAREFIRSYNDTLPSAMEQRAEMLKTFFATVQERVLIEQPFYCTYGYNVHWGNNAFGNCNLTILDHGTVYIGDNVMMGPNVQLITACHPLEVEERNALVEWAEPIILGDNVWLGAGVIVLPGVTVGENSVIGAGSVVAKDIPANVLAVGNPCRVVREIGKK